MLLRRATSITAAIDPISRYRSGRTDSIVTADREKPERSMNLLNSAGVFWNAAPFANGSRYGSRPEVGLSTSKTPARGPIGLGG